jgi:hypothetical protein
MTASLRRFGALLLLPWLCAAAPAAEPMLAVVVPAARAGEKLDIDDVAQIFKRRKVYWSDGRRIEPVNLPADHPLRRRFSRAVLRLTPEALDDYWNEQYFQGVLPPHVLASEAAVARFVAGTAQAIGYLPYCRLDAALHPVLLLSERGGVLPPQTPEDCTAN